MPSLILTNNIQLLTRDRGWQFVSELTLMDHIQCVQWNRHDPDATPTIVWDPLYRLNTSSCCYMQYLASKGFLLTYDGGKVVLHKGDLLHDDKRVGREEEEDIVLDGDVSSKYTSATMYEDEWSTPDPEVIVTEQLDSQLHRSRFIVSVLNEQLDKVSLNTPENLPYLHTREHKLWCTVYKIYWTATTIEKYKSKYGLRDDLEREVTLTTDWVSMPLLKQGGPLFPGDPFDAANCTAVYALSGLCCV